MFAPNDLRRSDLYGELRMRVWRARLNRVIAMLDRLHDRFCILGLMAGASVFVHAYLVYLIK